MRLTRITRSHSSMGVLPGLGDRTGDAGVVDEDVDLAERGDRLVPGRARPGPSRATSTPTAMTLPRLASSLAVALGQRLVAVPDGDARAAVEQPLDHGAADALGAAGDDRSAAGEIES